MKTFTKLVAAGAFAVSATLSANSAAALPFILSGMFTVKAVNATNLTGTESQATLANFNAAMDGTLSPNDSVFVTDEFTYTGDLDFETKVGSSTTISSWLATGTPGGVSGLNPVFGNLVQSTGNIGTGTATTTFYLFEAMLGALTDIKVFHDDGFAIFDDGVQIGGKLGPTSLDETDVGDFNGGKFSLLYVATNSDPSILKVQAVPLPAAAWLLLAVSGGLIAAKRRSARRAA